MYLGQIVELGRAEEIYARPLMPYKEALIASFHRRMDVGNRLY